MPEEKFVDFTVDQAFLDQNPEVAADLKIGDVIQVPDIKDQTEEEIAAAKAAEEEAARVAAEQASADEAARVAAEEAAKASVVDEPVTATEIINETTPESPKIHAGKVVVSFDGTHAVLESFERVPMTQEEFDALPKN